MSQGNKNVNLYVLATKKSSPLTGSHLFQRSVLLGSHLLTRPRPFLPFQIHLIMLLQASQCQVENLEVSKSIARISNHEVPAWKDKAAAKRKAQFDSIPPQWRLPVLDQLPVNTLEFLRTSGFLDQEELAITETTDAKLLLAQIASRQYSAVRVIQAFSKRAALAQQLIGCCTEMFFEEALERAKQLDDVLAKTGKTVGPLHGLPISFKDLIDVEDQDTTWGSSFSSQFLDRSLKTDVSHLLGWVGLIGKPAMRNSILVEALVAQGAVPYVKTNLSQSIMVSTYNLAIPTGFPLSPSNQIP